MGNIETVQVQASAAAQVAMSISFSIPTVSTPMTVHLSYEDRCKSGLLMALRNYPLGG
jgi:hypothetical protein